VISVIQSNLAYTTALRPTSGQLPVNWLRFLAKAGGVQQLPSTNHRRKTTTNHRSSGDEQQAFLPWTLLQSSMVRLKLDTGSILYLARAQMIRFYRDIKMC
jgi:hypothetical protein